VNAAIAATALMLIAAAAVRRGASWSAALIVVGPLAVLTAYRFCYRPESMLYLAMGATLYALERRWLVALPVLCFALSLFHPTALILLLVIGCYAVDAVIADRKRGPASWRRSQRRCSPWSSRREAGTGSSSR
jgi:hypothetical protein